MVGKQKKVQSPKSKQCVVNNNNYSVSHLKSIFNVVDYSFFLLPAAYAHLKFSKIYMQARAT